MCVSVALRAKGPIYLCSAERNKAIYRMSHARRIKLALRYKI